MKKNYDYLVSEFESKLPRAIVTPLEGTYLAWVNLSYLGVSSIEVAEFLTSSKVLVNAGEVYGENENSFIRINLATSLDLLKNGLDKLINGIIKLEQRLNIGEK